MSESIDVAMTVEFTPKFVKADPYIGSYDRWDNIGTIFFNGCPIYSANCYGFQGQEAQERLFSEFARDIEPERETRLA